MQPAAPVSFSAHIRRHSFSPSFSLIFPLYSKFSITKLFHALFCFYIKIKIPEIHLYFGENSRFFMEKKFLSIFVKNLLTFHFNSD